MKLKKVLDDSLNEAELWPAADNPKKKKAFQELAKQGEKSKEKRIKRITDYVYDKMMEGEMEHDSDLWNQINLIVKENYKPSLTNKAYVGIVKSEGFFGEDF
jgi:2',3'-cyclic-nucleotide 2'-phosphodiesterase (5'-nucleotidase family)